MSICALRGVQRQLCRQAFLWATRATTQRNLFPRPVFVATRSYAQNNLYQMKKPCQNEEILSAKGCEPGGGKGSKESGDCENNDDRKKRMMLYAILAAIGAGGLLFWIFGRADSKEDKVEEEPVRVVIGRKDPATSADLPRHVPYILIGGGTAAFSAFRAIKSNDARAKVLMISDELVKPYMRPPLSKELWYTVQNSELSKDLRFKQWTGAERSLYFEPEQFFVDPTNLMSKANGGIAVAQGYKVKKVDPERRIVTLSDGYEIAYNECLIATGSTPKTLPVFNDAPSSVKDKVMTYRTPADFERLKAYADENKTIAIIGNGFMGCELSCALGNYTKKKAPIYHIFPEEGALSRVLPKYLSKWTLKKIEEKGVCVINNSTVKDVERYNSQVKLMLNNGKTVLADIVVVCVGCDPNTDIAATSGLEVSKRMGGFIVNSEMEARRNLFVAGDASCFHDPVLGRRRVEHHDHSVVSGRLAGENMTGQHKSYTHQSMFWSDLGPDIGYEGIGLVDATLPTVGIFALQNEGEKRTDNLSEAIIDEYKPNKKSCDDMPPVECHPDDKDHYGRGVIFYLKDEKVVGILLWNLFNRIGLARTIINQNERYQDLNEVAKLFEIHS